jgi:hypothetical protein
MSERNLTDGDVDAIVAALTNKVKQEFYADLGRGVWSVAWKAVVGLLIALAAYGSLKGYK